MNTISKISSSEKVVIIRSANIGDWIVTIPFVNYLLKEIKLQRLNIFSLIMNNTGLNPVNMVLDDDDPLKNNSTVLRLNVNSILQFISNKRNVFKDFGRVDHVILLTFTHDNYLSVFKKRILAYLIFGFRVKYHGFVINSKKGFISESQYLSIFDKLEVCNSNLSTSEFSFPQHTKSLNDKLKIGLYIHSKLEMKIWPMEYYLKLSKLIVNQYQNVEFVLLGSKEDFKYNQIFLELFSQEHSEINIYNIAGSHSINETLKDLASLDLVICNDGAPTHLSGLTNTPTLAIYTYKEPIGSWEPVINKNYISIRKDVTCKHCFLEKCPNPVCIKLITEQDVFPFVIKLLSSEKTISEIILLTDDVSISTYNN